LVAAKALGPEAFRKKWLFIIQLMLLSNLVGPSP